MRRPSPRRRPGEPVSVHQRGEGRIPRGRLATGAPGCPLGLLCPGVLRDLGPGAGRWATRRADRGGPPGESRHPWHAGDPCRPARRGAAALPSGAVRLLRGQGWRVAAAAAPGPPSPIRRARLPRTRWRVTSPRRTAVGPGRGIAPMWQRARAGRISPSPSTRTRTGSRRIRHHRPLTSHHVESSPRSTASSGLLQFLGIRLGHGTGTVIEGRGVGGERWRHTAQQMVHVCCQRAAPRDPGCSMQPARHGLTPP